MQRLAACLAALIAVSAAAQTDRLVTELKIAEARLRIPDASDDSMAALENFLREQAKKAEIGIQIVPAPTTRLSPSLELRALDVSGREQLAEVQIFLAFVSNLRGKRLTDYESLQLVAQPEGRVAFRVRVTMACWVGGPPVDAPATLAAIRTVEERFQSDRMVNAIGDVERELRGHAIALTELTFGADTRVSGVTLGAAARDALTTALESSAFRVGHIDFVPRGDCQAFTAPMELLAGPPPEHVAWADSNVFDGNTAAPCTPPRASAPRRVAARGDGGVTMHLRNVDAADVFRALNAATKKSFVVDSAVGGRFDVDFDRVAPEAAFAALKSAGIAVGPGPLHFVGAPLAVPAGDYKGEGIDVSIRDADLSDVVQLLGMIGKRELAAPPPGARLSIFATNEPWDRLLAAVQLAKPTSAAPQPPPQPSEKRTWWRIDHIDRWSTRDLTFAGVVNTEAGWVAYAYTPGAEHKMFELTPATQFRDGRVASIDASGVTLDNGAKLTLR
jgi:hypothetical protein